MTTKAPIKGAVRIHRLAPASDGDAFGFVKRALESIGWTVLDEDYMIDGDGFVAYVMVHAWAIPPNREVEQ